MSEAIFLLIGLAIGAVGAGAICFLLGVAWATKRTTEPIIREVLNQSIRVDGTIDGAAVAAALRKHDRNRGR